MSLRVLSNSETAKYQRERPLRMKRTKKDKFDERTGKKYKTSPIQGANETQSYNK